MRIVVLALLALACDDKGDTGQQRPGTETGLPPGEFALVEGGVKVCTDPNLRAAGHFTAKRAGGLELVGAFLGAGGLAVEDFDQDGFVDTFFAGRDAWQLWFGAGDNLFDEQAATALPSLNDYKDAPLTSVYADGGLDAVGGVPVDYDADGDLDLFVTRWEQPNLMLRNEGGRTFVDVSDATGLGSCRGPADPTTGLPTCYRHQSASWADMDLDGDLDLFVGSYGEWTEIDPNDATADCSNHLPDGGTLYRNNGDGTFADESELLPQEVHDGYAFSSGWYDVDSDGYPELFVFHDDGRCGPSVLVDNVGGQSFALDLGAGFYPNRQSHDMGVAVGDLNGDEAPDFLTTSFNTNEYVQSAAAPANPDAVNGLTWYDFRDQRNLQVDVEEAQQAFGWGAEFGDVDNDGDLDLAANYGYWTIFDGPQDPPQQRDGLWIQAADGTFEDQADADIWQVGDIGYSRGLVLADVNDDGWLDLIKRIIDEPTASYLSVCGDENWVRVKLRAPAPNTHGVGAKIRITAGDSTQVRWITTGSTGLYSGAPLEAHFGLGSIDRIDRLDVIWPDMEVSTFEDIAARQVLTVNRTAP